MFILLIDVDDDTRSVVFNDLSLHDKGKAISYVYLMACQFYNAQKHLNRRCELGDMVT
jgi:hypothetical protein